MTAGNANKSGLRARNTAQRGPNSHTTQLQRSTYSCARHRLLHLSLRLRTHSNQRGASSTWPHQWSDDAETTHSRAPSNAVHALGLTAGSWLRRRTLLLALLPTAGANAAPSAAAAAAATATAAAAAATAAATASAAATTTTGAALASLGRQLLKHVAREAAKVTHRRVPKSSPLAWRWRFRPRRHSGCWQPWPTVTPATTRDCHALMAWQRCGARACSPCLATERVPRVSRLNLAVNARQLHTMPGCDWREVVDGLNAVLGDGDPSRPSLLVPVIRALWGVALPRSLHLEVLEMSLLPLEALASRCIEAEVHVVDAAQPGLGGEDAELVVLAEPLMRLVLERFPTLRTHAVTGRGAAASAAAAPPPEVASRIWAAVRGASAALSTSALQRVAQVVEHQSLVNTACVDAYLLQLQPDAARGTLVTPLDLVLLSRCQVAFTRRRAMVTALVNLCEHGSQLMCRALHQRSVTAGVAVSLLYHGLEWLVRSHRSSAPAWPSKSLVAVLRACVECAARADASDVAKACSEQVHCREASLPCAVLHYCLKVTTCGAATVCCAGGVGPERVVCCCARQIAMVCCGRQHSTETCPWVCCAAGLLALAVTPAQAVQLLDELQGSDERHARAECGGATLHSARTQRLLALLPPAAREALTFVVLRCVIQLPSLGAVLPVALERMRTRLASDSEALPDSSALALITALSSALEFGCQDASLGTTCDSAVEMISVRMAALGCRVVRLPRGELRVALSPCVGDDDPRWLVWCEQPLLLMWSAVCSMHACSRRDDHGESSGCRSQCGVYMALPPLPHMVGACAAAQELACTPARGVDVLYQAADVMDRDAAANASVAELLGTCRMFALASAMQWVLASAGVGRDAGAVVQRRVTCRAAHVAHALRLWRCAQSCIVELRALGSAAAPRRCASTRTDAAAQSLRSGVEAEEEEKKEGKKTEKEARLDDESGSDAGLIIRGEELRERVRAEDRTRRQQQLERAKVGGERHRVRRVWEAAVTRSAAAMSEGGGVDVVEAPAGMSADGVTCVGGGDSDMQRGPSVSLDDIEARDCGAGVEGAEGQPVAPSVVVAQDVDGVPTRCAAVEDVGVVAQALGAAVEPWVCRIESFLVGAAPRYEVLATLLPLLLGDDPLSLRSSGILLAWLDAMAIVCSQAGAVDSALDECALSRLPLAATRAAPSGVERVPPSLPQLSDASVGVCGAPLEPGAVVHHAITSGLLRWVLLQTRQLNRWLRQSRTMIASVSHEVHLRAATTAHATATAERRQKEQAARLLREALKDAAFALRQGAGVTWVPADVRVRDVDAADGDDLAVAEDVQAEADDAAAADAGTAAALATDARVCEAVLCLHFAFLRRVLLLARAVGDGGAVAAVVLRCQEDTPADGTLPSACGCCPECASEAARARVATALSGGGGGCTTADDESPAVMWLLEELVGQWRDTECASVCCAVVSCIAAVALRPSTISGLGHLAVGGLHALFPSPMLPFAPATAWHTSVALWAARGHLSLARVPGPVVRPVTACLAPPSCPVACAVRLANADAGVLQEDQGNGIAGRSGAAFGVRSPAFWAALTTPLNRVETVDCADIWVQFITSFCCLSETDFEGAALVVLSQLAQFISASEVRNTEPTRVQWCS